MHHKFHESLLLFCLLFTGTLAAQVSIKPYYGFYKPRMNTVNAKILADIEDAGILLDFNVPPARQFDGETYWGGQLEYHLNEDYFFNASFSIYKESIATSAETDIWRFNYERDVRMYDVVFNIHYYFDYSSWRRFNKYISVGLGYLQVDANSLTFSDHSNYSVDSIGEFTGTSLTAVLSAGANFRLSEFLQIWTEGGFQYGSLGKLDGKATDSIGSPSEDILSSSEFDLSGFFLRGGIGFSLAFLQ